jgi:hypothetical protein
LKNILLYLQSNKNHHHIPTLLKAVFKFLTELALFTGSKSHAKQKKNIKALLSLCVKIFIIPNKKGGDRKEIGKI